MKAAGQPVPVLVVDDSDDDRFFFRRAISRCGCSIELFEAEDAEDAIDFLTRESGRREPGAIPLPKYVFLDLNLPGRNGFDVLGWLKTQPFRDQLRVIILSGSNEPRDRELASNLGADAYLVKPINAEILRQHLLSS